MTEEEWLTLTHFEKLYGYLKRYQSAAQTPSGRRRLRLFACGACRLFLWNIPVPECYRQAVAAAEAYVDRGIDKKQFQAARDRCLSKAGATNSSVMRQAAITLLTTTAESITSVVLQVKSGILNFPRKDNRAETTRTLCTILRDLFGNPFRPLTVDPTWLTWDEGAIPRIARTIYAERAHDQLPVLADALEEAGCTEPQLLEHCRAPGPHVLGCWAVDLLLGKSCWRSP